MADTDPEAEAGASRERSQKSGKADGRRLSDLSTLYQLRVRVGAERGISTETLQRGIAVNAQSTSGTPGVSIRRQQDTGSHSAQGMKLFGRAGSE
jgi:hypothetical protein